MFFKLTNVLFLQTQSAIDKIKDLSKEQEILNLVSLIELDFQET